ncbi:MAG: hypothetical protein LBK18_08315 [Prevotellaceae bacterium]|jgi:hypothetical protein|nr:hypothetical protein [Prevotellaceae bacterium]
MDCTYFGRAWGVVVLMDSQTGKKLWRKYVRHEKLVDYQEGISYILSKKYQLRGIVCDGLKGIFKQFSAYPVQFCQYHQVAVIRRYLTLNPKLEASKELWLLAKEMAKLTKDEFTIKFERWELKWRSYLNERTVDKQTGKSHFTHKNLRSAWLSIKRNLMYLFVFEEVENMPNTNNALEGTFAALKNSLRNHSGMSKENRKRFIDGFFKA